MSNTQHIIVYTPVEDALYNGGSMIPLIGALIVGAVVFVLMSKIGGRFGKCFKRFTDGLFVGAALVAILAAAWTFHTLMI